MISSIPCFIEKSNKVFEIKEDCISTLDLQQIPLGLTELQVFCNKFEFKSDLQAEFLGKSLVVNTNNVDIRQSCTVNLSGNPKQPFTSDARSDILGIGRNGKNGFVGENGGNFTLTCKNITCQNDATLTIISNGADGMNGQNGGNGKDGTNGKDATQQSFIINKCDWKLYNPMCAESREMYKKFALDSWDNNTSQSVIRTKDGLTAYIYVQTSHHEDWGLMLVKGTKGQPGRRGGHGGLGEQGGHPGNVIIECEDTNYSKYIKIIKNPGKDGKNGVRGLNGVNGRLGRDLWKYDMRSWDQPKVFGEDKPTKFKLVWGEGPFTVFDSIKKDYP